MIRPDARPNGAAGRTHERRFRRLALGVTVLAFAVVVLGAWVRLTGAGLGCPDWPGCYGRIVVGPEGSGLESIAEGAAVDGGKAWREMVHRYFAGGLGLAILALAVVAVRNRRRAPGAGGPIALPVALVVLVAFQAALGAWTVTLRLQPAVVVAHLLGGMAILGLLWRVYLGPPVRAGGAGPEWVRPAAAIGLAVLAMQIALGGWTSANYAALACPDFPTCHGRWWPDGDYAAGFRLWQEAGSRSGFEGGVLTVEARIGIHMVHRIGALVTVLYLGGLCAAALWRGRPDRGLAAATLSVLGLLVVQAALGVSNVWLGLPLGVAVAHNAAAALLLLALVTMHHRSGRSP